MTLNFLRRLGFVRFTALSPSSDGSRFDLKDGPVAAHKTRTPASDSDHGIHPGVEEAENGESIEVLIHSPS